MMNIAVAQSGGPTCAINSSLAGVFAEAAAHDEIHEIYGSLNGINGILNEKLVDMRSELDSAERLSLLKKTPATALGSCRVKLPDSGEIYEKIFGVFSKYKIGAFFYIGGNDSMDTVMKLSRYGREIGSDVRIIGVPKTIDNDVMATDHTPGFGSAAKYIAATVREITRDSQVYGIDSVTIIEIMGRDAGWLAASTCVLRAVGEVSPHLIYIPEMEFSSEKFISDVRKKQAEYGAVVAAVSEGVKTADGKYASAGHTSGVTDVFGHQYLSGIGKYLEGLVRDRIGCKVRSVELNVMQRCASHIASKTDIDEAFSVGRAAVRAALSGESGRMMVFRRLSDLPYEITIDSADISDIANNEKPVPAEWINSDGNGITEEAISYFLPLIQGEVMPEMRAGLPLHFRLRSTV